MLDDSILDYINRQAHNDHNLETPDNSILDYINRQAHNDEQMDQALQTYQALTS